MALQPPPLDVMDGSGCLTSRRKDTDMWVDVYYSETGEQDSFTLAKVQEAHLFPQQPARSQTMAWVPGLGQVPLRRPRLLGYGWWVMVAERAPGPLGELTPLAPESAGN
jgi:hypothetical protein